MLPGESPRKEVGAGVHTTEPVVVQFAALSLFSQRYRNSG
jgi:hypothetical protein